MFFADNFFLGFENDQVLFHTTRNLHSITIYLACHHKALHWNLFVIILRILSGEIFNLFTKTIGVSISFIRIFLTPKLNMASIVPLTYPEAPNVRMIL